MIDQPSAMTFCPWPLRHRALLELHRLLLELHRLCRGQHRERGCISASNHPTAPHRPRLRGPHTPQAGSGHVGVWLPPCSITGSRWWHCPSLQPPQSCQRSLGPHHRPRAHPAPCPRCPWPRAANRSQCSRPASWCHISARQPCRCPCPLQGVLLCSGGAAGAGAMEAGPCQPLMPTAASAWQLSSGGLVGPHVTIGKMLPSRPLPPAPPRNLITVGRPLLPPASPQTRWQTVGTVSSSLAAGLILG